MRTNNNDDIVDFYESMSTTHQFNPDANIYSESISKISFGEHNIKYIWCL